MELLIASKIVALRSAVAWKNSITFQNCMDIYCGQILLQSISFDAALLSVMLCAV